MYARRCRRVAGRAVVGARLAVNLSSCNLNAACTTGANWQLTPGAGSSSASGGPVRGSAPTDAASPWLQPVVVAVACAHVCTRSADGRGGGGGVNGVGHGAGVGSVGVPWAAAVTGGGVGVGAVWSYVQTRAASSTSGCGGMCVGAPGGVGTGGGGKTSGRRRSDDGGGGGGGRGGGGTGEGRRRYSYGGGGGRSYFEHFERNPTHVLYAVIGVNCAVWAAWQSASQTFMRKHFMVSWRNVASRPWTVLTCAVSQMAPMHLFANMYALYLFGEPLVYKIGARRFLAAYAIAALAASTAHLGYERHLANRRAGGYRYTDRQRRQLLYSSERPAVGASGSVAAVAIMCAMSFPRHRLLFFGVVPMTMPVLVGAYVLYDFYNVSRAQRLGVRTGTSHAAHLGGYGAGALLFFLL